MEALGGPFGWQRRSIEQVREGGKGGGGGEGKEREYYSPVTSIPTISHCTNNNFNFQLMFRDQY